MQLADRLLGILFYVGDAVTYVDLAQMVDVPVDEVRVAADALHERLAESGIRVVRTDDRIQLMTAPELDPLVDALRKESLSREIGKAGAETLAIVLYHGTVSRARIDAIRGVQSGAILRSLLVRGLVERVQDAQQTRAIAYRATPELLAHLGISDRSELTDFHAVMAALEAFEGSEATADAGSPKE